MATGVIYKVNCGDGCGPQKRCKKKYDAFCVIYHGEDRPDLGINKGDNMEEIVEKLEAVINNLLNQITNLTIYITEEINSIYEQINIINGILEDLGERIDDLEERIDDLENTLCQRIAECQVVQDLLDDIYDLETNFCNKVAACRDEIWELVPNKTGCSTSTSSYVAWSSSSTKNGYYIETYEDVNPLSPTYGQTKVERRSELDGQCIAVGSDWVTIDRDCSISSSSYDPSPGSPSAIYGWKKEKDSNPNSPTYEEERWVRDTSYDRTCNPPSLPPQEAEGCMVCAKVQILSTEGQTTDFTSVQFDNLSSPFTYTPGTGICIRGPLWDENNISTVITGTASVEITDPMNLGWEVLVDKQSVYTGTGDFSGPISFSITMKYIPLEYREGTYYVCEGRA